MGKLLEVKKLNYAYKDGDEKRVIFSDANAYFESGKFYTITGDSGSGKTTFLYLLAGLDYEFGGEIFYLNKNIKDIGIDKYRKNYVSLVFQNYNLIEYLSPLLNIQLALDILKIKKSEKEIKKVLEIVGLEENKLKRKVSSLSGGEKQKVAIARSLIVESKIILADEPSGNLDHQASLNIVKIFKKLAHDFNRCVIMVTHNKELVHYADENYFIDQQSKKIVNIKLDNS